MFRFFSLSSRWSATNLAKGHSCSPRLPQKKVTNFSLEGGPTIFLHHLHIEAFPFFVYVKFQSFVSSVVLILI